MKTVAGIFSSISQAERALHELQRQGISSDSLHVIAGNENNRHDEYLKKSKKASTSTAAAAASSASFGGGVGILAALAALAIPGVGPIIAGGGMATVLTGFGIGAASGGLIGAFKNMGISHEDAPLYEEAVRRGAVIALAEVDDDKMSDAINAMNTHGANDIQREAQFWRDAGWSGPPPIEHPHPADDSFVAHEPPEKMKTTGS
jgi:uncharacterized membrane protein